MADYESTGNALKKLVKMGRKNPMPFAFCPGSGDEAIFATHLKKSPEIISKAARKDSGQNKVAFGTYTLEGKLLILTMVKELPAVAKKLKKHLRGEGLNLTKGKKRTTPTKMTPPPRNQTPRQGGRPRKHPRKTAWRRSRPI